MRSERITRTMVKEFARELGLSIIYDTRGGYSVRTPRGTVGTPTLRETLAFLRGYQDGKYARS